MNKVALITGGAKGIGKAIALQLASDGFNIVINYLTSHTQAVNLQQEIKDKYHVECMIIQCDVSKENEVDIMVNQVINTFKRIDVLVNNAAIDLSNLFYQKTVDEFKRTMDVNVIGAYNCTRAVSYWMKEHDTGYIINIASTNGIDTYNPMSIDYDASKAALISLTHNLAVKYAPQIHVNAIAPGFIGTESELEGYDEEFLQQECDKILLKRYGQPQEVAYLVSFLVSGRADYINNSVLRIDGGNNRGL